MKTTSLYFKFLSLFLVIITIFSVTACTGNSDESTEITEPESIEPEITDAPYAEAEMIDLISDGKLLYTIVRPDDASQLNIKAATAIHTFIKNLGIESKLSDWGDNNIDTPEILVGKTQFFPAQALEGIDLSSIGTDGFVIRHFGGKIIIVAANDIALPGAVNYFIENYIKMDNGRVQIPKDLLYISSKGTFLSNFTLNGCKLSDYAFTADEGAGDSRIALEALFNDKSFSKVSQNGNRNIRLVIDSSAGDMISAKFENGDLIIKAKDATAMKKAIVCFWFENIAYTTGSFDLPGDFNYSRDLSQTVFYSDFSVKQSENECCIDALIEAHNYANEKGYKVFADCDAKYYISSIGKTVVVKTDVEWGNAKFIIDDSAVTVEERLDWIFTISPTAEKYTVKTINKLDKNAKKIDLALSEKSLVVFNDSTTKQYFRYGHSTDKGQLKRDLTIVDTDGSVASNAPLVWDFDNITSIDIYPIDSTPLAVSGGEFTTVANCAENASGYYSRGINIARSNTNLSYVKHFIVGEDVKTSAPYSGFVWITNCAYVTVEGCVLSGHKYFDAGTYDIGGKNMIAVTFKNCTQANDICDSDRWGIMGTNYCKDVTYDGCMLSRFDTHKGITNATIKNSIIGHGGISVSGFGTLLLENTASYADSLINLRADYGSTWDGDIIIRNCQVYCNQRADYSLIVGTNMQSFDFGYTCYMPKSVTVDGLYVDTKMTTQVFKIKLAPAGSTLLFPYIPAESVTVTDFSSSGSNTIVLGHEDGLLKDTVFTVN